MIFQVHRVKCSSVFCLQGLMRTRIILRSWKRDQWWIWNKAHTKAKSIHIGVWQNNLSLHRWNHLHQLIKIWLQSGIIIPFYSNGCRFSILKNDTFSMFTNLSYEVATFKVMMVHSEKRGDWREQQRTCSQGALFDQKYHPVFPLISIISYGV